MAVLLKVQRFQLFLCVTNKIQTWIVSLCCVFTCYALFLSVLLPGLRLLAAMLEISIHQPAMCFCLCF